MKRSKCNDEEKEAVSMTEDIKEKTDVCSKVKNRERTTNEMIVEMFF